MREVMTTGSKQSMMGSPAGTPAQIFGARMSFVVHINGWPGSGKLTIARPLAKRLDARLLDNHTLLNPAESLFERRDPSYWPLRSAIRSLVFDYAARLPTAVPLVFTDALSDDPHDSAIFDSCRDLAARRGVPILSVVLDCDLQENLRRLAAPRRAELQKLTRSDMLSGLRAKYRLLRPEGVERLDLDVTGLTPEQAVTAIWTFLASADRQDLRQRMRRNDDA